jgi:small subunit ribosomal protein S3
MGQKTHPTGYRLGITADWKSRWFAGRGDDYSEKVLEDRKIRTFIREHVGRAGIKRIEIERSFNKIKVIIHVARPGMVIGRGGSRIELLRGGLEKITKTKPEIVVEEVKIPAISAQLISEEITRQIEMRRAPNRVINAEVEKAMLKGAEGVRVEAKGRLGGGRFARKSIVTRGKVPLQTIRAKVDYAQEEANTKYGTIGIKVWVYLGEEEI